MSLTIEKIVKTAIDFNTSVAYVILDLLSDDEIDQDIYTSIKDDGTESRLEELKAFNFNEMSQEQKMKLFVDSINSCRRGKYLPKKIYGV